MGNPTLMETLPDCCSSMARVLTSTQQLARHPQMVNGMATNPAEDEEPAVFNQVESNDEIITVHTQEPEEKKNEELKTEISFGYLNGFLSSSKCNYVFHKKL